jgi:hypothetical protein
MCFLPIWVESTEVKPKNVHGKTKDDKNNKRVDAVSTCNTRSEPRNEHDLKASTAILK